METGWHRRSNAGGTAYGRWRTATTRSWPERLTCRPPRSGAGRSAAESHADPPARLGHALDAGRASLLHSGRGRPRGVWGDGYVVRLPPGPLQVAARLRRELRDGGAGVPSDARRRRPRCDMGIGRGPRAAGLRDRGGAFLRIRQRDRGAQGGRLLPGPPDAVFDSSFTGRAVGPGAVLDRPAPQVRPHRLHLGNAGGFDATLWERGLRAGWCPGAVPGRCP